jgi:NADH:ubiquinone oxidoreductase subunit E
MADSNQDITICMGSSCFSRGNKKMVSIIKEYLKDKNLEGSVVLQGAHCMGLCDMGPVLKIGAEIFRQVDESNLEVILDKKFGITNK